MQLQAASRIAVLAIISKTNSDAFARVLFDLFIETFEYINL